MYSQFSFKWRTLIAAHLRIERFTGYSWHCCPRKLKMKWKENYRPAFFLAASSRIHCGCSVPVLPAPSVLVAAMLPLLLLPPSPSTLPFASLASFRCAFLASTRFFQVGSTTCGVSGFRRARTGASGDCDLARLRSINRRFHVGSWAEAVAASAAGPPPSPALFGPTS